MSTGDAADNSVGSHGEEPVSEAAEGIINVCVFNTAMGQPILVNGSDLGSTTSPSELVRVSYNRTECFIQLFYNKGSQITLINLQCAPIVCGTRKSAHSIRIGLVL